MRSALLAPVADRADRVGVEAGGLERLDVREAVDDPSADLQLPRPLALPPPLLEGAGRDQPAVGQALLVQMLHRPSSRVVAHREPPRYGRSHGRTWTFAASKYVDSADESRDAAGVLSCCSFSQLPASCDVRARSRDIL